MGASLGRSASPIVLPYRSYGTRERFLVMGRVLENKLAAVAGIDDSIWQNLLNTYRRLESDEVPGALVRAQFGEVTAEAVSDEEGYFRLWLDGVSDYSTCGWAAVELTL